VAVKKFREVPMTQSAEKRAGKHDIHARIPGRSQTGIQAFF
jgi:hypothetical protein